MNVQNPILSGSKNLKLEKITRPKNIALIDIAKIDKIEKEFSILTKRNEKEEVKQVKESEKKGSKDEMRESRLLLLKNITPQPIRKQNMNLLSSLV